MFDAKSLIEQIMRGAGQPAAGQQAGGGLGDILGQLGQALGQGGGSAAQAAPGGGGGGLADILRQMVPQEAPGGRGQAPAGGGLGDLLKNLGGGQAQAPGGQSGSSGGGLGDLLGKLQEQLGQGAQRAPGAQGGGAGGGLMDILGQVLGQATEGVKDGARRVDGATGASGHMRDAVGKATGQSPEDLLAQLKDLIANNQLGAGAAAGGLGAVVLGTKTGRALASNAIKIGGLALIGGLAYKALQNYQAGRPLVSGPTQLAAAPQGSGFEVDAVSNEAAIGYIRAMIAAAAADGRIDEAEQTKILGGLKQAGLDQHAEEFLANELNAPASVDDLVQTVRTEEEAVQLFTAARISVDLDSQEEHDFLVALAQALQLDGKLVAHIDATARAAA